MDNYLKITRVFERDIGERVVSVRDCRSSVVLHGKVANVFAVETGEGSYIIKFYRSADYPERGKAVFVSDKLSEYNIPHAKIFSYNRDDKDIPNGYIIEEIKTPNFSIE